MIYKLKASGRQFDVLGTGDDFTRVRFLDSKGEETLSTADLVAVSDFPGPTKPEAQQSTHSHDWECVHGNCPQGACFEVAWPTVRHFGGHGWMWGAPPYSVKPANGEGQ